MRVRGAAPERTAAPSSTGLFERLAASPITYLITAINIGVFVWTEYFGGGTVNESTLLRAGAVEPFHVWAGDYWRLLTCVFVHGSVLHIAVNTYMSLGWSTALERVLGRWRFLLLYVTAGIGGSCASVAIGLLRTPHISVGASGALFGVVGATLALRRRQYSDNRSFFADRGVRSIALQFAILTLVGFTVLPLDNAAHLGGLVVGGAMGLLFTARAPRNGWLAFAAMFGAALVAAVRPGMPPGDDGIFIATYARAYLTGNSPGMPDGAWHKDIPRGVRLAEKGCNNRVALACEVLAQYLDRQGNPADSARSKALHRKTCEIDPPLCEQIP